MNWESAFFLDNPLNIDFFFPWKKWWPVIIFGSLAKGKLPFFGKSAALHSFLSQESQLGDRSPS
jgi:hypothetical protein